jgi:hypothetical protein
MRTNFNAALFAVSLMSLSFAAHAGQPLLPARGSDQVPLRLVSLPLPPGQFERAPVSFSWALDPQSSLAQTQPHAAESREYWQTVDGAELQAGVQLRTTAPGAVIRISPASGSAPLDTTGISITGNGKAARLEQAANADELRAAGMDVDAGTTVVKLARENAGGDYALHARGARGRYVVHVFEPDSDVVLKAQADREHVLGGGTIAVTMEMSRGSHPLTSQAEALLVAPDGSSRPITVRRDASGTLTARVRLPQQASAAAGLWELQVFANAGGIQRDARTAFGVAAPTARLGGSVDVDATRLRIDMPVQAGSPGRYEVRGTLYATASDGTLAPVSEAHAAAWMERGNGSLALAFDRSHVPAGFGAPFEVRQLELNDQTRLAPLERREQAFRF